MRIKLGCSVAILMCLSGISAQDHPNIVAAVFRTPAESVNADKATPNYVLGPDDQITVHALDLDEIQDKPVRIDLRGDINLPLAGRVRAAGLTVEQLETAIAERLKPYLQKPTVTVSIAEFRSEPVSVLGAVATPGVLQLQGRKTLFEVLSQAGGLKNEAGNIVVITRQREWGPIPLPTAKEDSSGRFSVAEVSVKSIMGAKNPEENIPICPNDVISVPKAELVYVIGAVKRPGGFILGDRTTISVLEVLSMAEGLDRTAAAKNAKILHAKDGTLQRTEIPVDVKRIMAGTSNDLSMSANDILFIPTSAGRNAAIRGMEAALQIGTGLAIYRF